eukprot:6211798-Pleurochrysis_carterae.AAC.4
MSVTEGKHEEPSSCFFCALRATQPTLASKRQLMPRLCCQSMSITTRLDHQCRAISDAQLQALHQVAQAASLHKSTHKLKNVTHDG